MSTSSDWVAARLSKAGIPHDPSTLKIDRGEDRLAVRFPDDRMAWFALNESGNSLLRKERRVLRLLAAHCAFPAPRVIYEDSSGLELRAIVPGAVNPPALRDHLDSDSAFAYQFGADLGRMLGEQHTHIPRNDLEGWLPPLPNWPRPEDLPYLPDVVQDSRLRVRIEQALQQRAEARRTIDTPVLIHTDLGLHNIAVDPASHRPVGIFDYEGAAFGDRHQDFAYLVNHRTDEPLLDGAAEAYEQATGVRIDRQRVYLLNAVAAIGFLGFRRGHSPEEEWCGRTLEADLTWTNEALTAAGLP